MKLSWLPIFQFWSIAFCKPARELYTFKTEPDLAQQVVDVLDITSDRSLLAPGYLFFAPQNFAFGWGPKIYDVDGLLIWDGKKGTSMTARQFHVCDYAGQTGQHLCWHEASKLGALRKGQSASDIHDYNRVFDNTYVQVSKNYSDTADLEAAVDAHEFNVIGGISFLQTVYERRRMDLTKWTGPKDGWVYDGCFQEVAISTGQPFFTWCYLDHLPLETFVYVKTEQQENFTTTIGGTGEFLDAWDFYHPNSVDKNEEGDYIVSGRHLDQIIKIAGPDSLNGEPGKTLWRLGGGSSDFEMDFTFSRQHHARYVSTNSTEMVISLFDNAWEGVSAEPSQPYSSAKLIKLNNETMKATLIREYPHPYGRLCRSGGSVQVLSNGNIFVGWGFIREVTEFHPNGTVLFHALLKNQHGPDLDNYRNFKSPWIGRPAQPPKIIAYSRYCKLDNTVSSPLLAFASWNGATEVKSWQFFTSEFSHGPWMSAGTFQKIDFETRAVLSDLFHPFVRADALDKDGNILGTASAATFVPNEEATKGCDNQGCFGKDYLHYDPIYSCADTCERRYTFLTIISTLIILGNELRSWMASRILCSNAGKIGRSAKYMKVRPSLKPTSSKRPGFEVLGEP